MKQAQPVDEFGNYNPYLAARLAWDERWGGMANREKAWRWIAVISLLAAIVSSGVANTLAFNIRNVMPYVAVVNAQDGNTITEADGTSLKQIEAARMEALRTWVDEWRFVTTDAELQKRAGFRALGRVARGSQAQDAVLSFWRDDPPDKRAEGGTVTIDVDKGVLKIGDNTYELQWLETQHSTQGGIVKQRWKASLTVAIVTPKTKEEAQENSLGLWITNASWATVGEREEKK